MEPAAIVIVILFVVVSAAILLTFVVVVARMIAKGGPRQLVFGGRVLETFGEVAGMKRSLVATLGRVHLVRTDRGDAVVLEVVGTAPLSYRMMALTLAAQDAHELAALLQRASASLDRRVP